MLGLWRRGASAPEERKSSSVTLDQLASLAGWLGWGTSTGAAVNEQNAVDVTAVFSCARVIAEGCAQVPVRVVSETFAGDRQTTKIARDHWAHKLLAKRPNDFQTSYEFREGMIFNAVIGKGAIAIKNVVRGEVRELLPIPAGSWSIEQRADWSIRFRVDYADKTHGYFERDQVFYLRGPSLNGFESLPAIRMAREAIGLSRALERQQAKLAGNGGKPSGVLSFASPLKAETKEKLRKTWEEKFGANGDGGIAILDGETQFHPMTMTSVDAQYVETRRFQIEEICRAFRVFPIMVMQADKAATYASAEQMQRMHVLYTLMPWMVRWEQAADRDILDNDTTYRVDLDDRGLARGDFKDQGEFYTKALGAGGQPGWMTPNEVRAEQGLNAIGDAWADEVPRGAMQPKGAGDGLPAA